MFTGIIRHQGKLLHYDTTAEPDTLSVSAPIDLMKQVKIGSSVMLSGVCLTLVKKTGGKLVFEIMPETLLKTTLAFKKNGMLVNLEPSLRMGDEVGGHFVYGHVDGVGKVMKFVKDEEGVLLSVELPEELVHYICPQGSIAIDGVSLTIARVKGNVVTMSLVDYTLKNTTLGAIKVGNKVNIECDMLAKYVERILLL